MADRTEGAGREWAPADPASHRTDEVAAIRADIQRTRARMSDTVEDIGERLNPDRLRAQLKGNLHDATIGKAENMARVAVDRVDETRHSIMDSIRDNPIPAAMVGVGLGWMFINGRRHRHDYEPRLGRPYAYPGRPGYYDDAGYSEFQGYGSFERSHYGPDRPSRPRFDEERDESLAHQAQDRVTGLAHDARDVATDLAHDARNVASDLAHDARETVSEVAHDARDAIGHTASRARAVAGDLARGTREGTHRVEDRFEDALQQSPLAIGAAAIAIGLAVGLSAPATRRESELMGTTRDRMVDRARDVAEDTTERVQHAAERVMDRAESTVRDGADDDRML
jgi:gas vesicle protein